MVIKSCNNYISSSTLFIFDIKQINAIRFQFKIIRQLRNILVGISGIKSIAPLSLTRSMILEMNSRKICLYLTRKDVMMSIVLLHWNGRHLISTLPIDTRKKISSILSYRCITASIVLPMLMPEVSVAEVNQMYTV